MIFEAQFPEAFYEVLPEQGWEEDNVNTNDLFRYQTPDGCAWEIMAGEEGTAELELHTYDTPGRFFLKLNYAAPQAVLDLLTDLQDVDGTDKGSLAEFFGKLAETDGIQSFFVKQTGDWRKKEEIVTHEIPVTPASIRSVLSPKFRPVPGISFYLAGVLESRVVIRKENFAAAFGRLKQYLVDHDMDDHPEADTLPALLGALLYQPPVLNEAGDIVNIPEGGDVWFPTEPLAPYIENGSYTLLQDDGWELHRVEYRDGQVFYHSEEI